MQKHNLIVTFQGFVVGIHCIDSFANFSFLNMKLILNIYGEVMHVKFYWVVMNYAEQGFPSLLYFRSPWDSHLLFLRVLGQISRVPCENA